MWNNEMTDFVTLVVLSYLVYVYTNVSGKSFIDKYGNLGLSFISSYF